MALTTFRTTKEVELEKPGKIKDSIFAGNGLFERKSSWLGTITEKIFDYTVKTLPELEETFEIKTGSDFPKIPLRAFYYIVKWYRDITLKNGEEAQINFYRFKGEDILKEKINNKFLKDIPGITIWNNDLFSYVPKQRNFSGLTSVIKEKEKYLKEEDVDIYYDNLCQKYGFYIETHSHNVMEAFCSGEDRRNSSNDGIQFVFGRLNQDKIRMYSWATIRETLKEGLNENEVSLFVDFKGFDYETEINKDGEIRFIFSFDDLEKRFNKEKAREELDKWDKQIIKTNYRKKKDFVSEEFGFDNTRSQYSMSDYFVDNQFENKNFNSYIYDKFELDNISIANNLTNQIIEILKRNNVNFENEMDISNDIFTHLYLNI